MFGGGGAEISEYFIFEITGDSKLEVMKVVTYKPKDTQQFAASLTLQGIQ